MSDVIKFKTKVTVAGESRYLEFFQASIGIGTQHWPCVKLVTHKPVDAENSMLTLTSKDIADDMEKRQKLVFSDRSSSDASVSIQVEGDGDNKFSFDGVLSGPAYSFSSHNVELSDQVIPLYTKINFLNLSIYKVIDDTSLVFDSPSLFGAGAVKTICELTAGMVKKWMDEVPAQFQNSPISEFLEAQHEVNGKVVKYWTELLDNSNESFGWKNIKEYLGGDYDRKLRETIANLTAQSSGTFSTVIDRFAEEFQCIYVPSWSSIGTYVSKKSLFENSEDLSVAPISLTINTANGFGLLPTAYLGIESPDVGQDTGRKHSQKRLIVCVPAENKGKGQMIRMIGPRWLQSGLHIGKAPNGAYSVAPDASKVEEHRKAAEQGTVEAQKKAAKGMEEFGLCAYAYLSLADSKAEINMPINFKLQVGKRYAIQNSKGELLFTGLLAHLTHTISTKSRNPVANTVASFTHIEVGSFKLPGVPH